MAREAQLSLVLSEFAHTLTTDFSVQDLLDHLVLRILEILPVSAAGVTLIAPGVAPRLVAASDHAALDFEQLQTTLFEGPCILAYETGDAVCAAPLVSDDRFPRFVAAARGAGLMGVYAFPLRHGDGQIGALDLYQNAPGELRPHDMRVAQTMADVAAAYVLNAQARADARETSDGFHHLALHDPLTGLVTVSCSSNVWITRRRVPVERRARSAFCSPISIGSNR